MPTPNTTIILYRGVPLDRDYRHTMYFASVSAQNTFFVNYTKIGGTFNNLSYQRISSNKIRVQASADDLKDCNYLAIKNTGYSNKTYYAFITDVEYINENTCEITYEEDVIQTYLFDGSVTLEECFVEREHSLTDNPGDNLQPENVDVGEYIDVSQGKSGELGANYSIVLSMPYIYWQLPSTIDQWYFKPAEGGFYSGNYSGLQYYQYNVNSAEDMASLQTMLDRITSGMWVCHKGTDGNLHNPTLDEDGPKKVMLFIAPSIFSSQTRSATKNDPVSKSIAKNNARNTTFGSYTPKNKKLYTFPYTMLVVSDPQGKESIYQFEKFTNPAAITFSMKATFAPCAEVVLYPNYYKGLGNNLNEKMVLTGFPFCGFSVDTYNSWLAQNKTSDMLNHFKPFIQTTAAAAFTGLSAMSGNLAGVATGAGGMMNGVKSAINDAVTQKERSISSVNSAGSVANATMLAMDEFDFHFYTRHITEEYARIIDLYFSMYGYACNKVKVPNISARPIYNYVKTNNCCLKGNANAAVLQKIESIFNRGVTFWKNAAYFGNYTTSDNSPVTP